ncbi:MAG: PorT family protein [Tannerella sp.]|jgi:hypothetical protein|nr:PorT family protein [Tannerella sp.]
MKEEERDLLDDLFRQKLRQLEADTGPEDWDAILARLPGGKKVSLQRQWRYWAAACIAVLLGAGGVYVFRPHEEGKHILAAGPVHSAPEQSETGQPVLEPGEPAVLIRTEQTPRRQAVPLGGEIIAEEVLPSAERIYQEELRAKEPLRAQAGRVLSVGRTPLIAEVAPVQTGRKTVSSRKWSFGTGIGGLTQGSGGVVNTYVLRSSHYLEDEELLSLNAASDQNQGKVPKTNIRHKTPATFGFSASRYLGNRFSLQTGLVYTLLISDWETQATAYNTKTRQTLHFAGIPLSLSYQIAGWNRFQVYASAGGQVDVNVAGRLRVRKYSDNLQTGVSYANERMKELLWSVNARAGVSYPLIPYISLFGELGVVHYFNNGSEVETIYSGKSLNISPQIGLRLSF